MKRIITAVTLILMLSGCSHMAEHEDLWKGAVSSILQLIGQNETEEARTDNQNNGGAK